MLTKFGNPQNDVIKCTFVQIHGQMYARIIFLSTFNFHLFLVVERMGSPCKNTGEFDSYCSNMAQIFLP